MIRIWERRDDETDAAWSGFQYYLQMKPRNASICAKMVGKSESTINRWIARYDWRERVAAFDNSAIELARQELRKELATSMKARWQQAETIANVAAEALEGKLASASPRTLSEAFYSAVDVQVKLIDRLELLKDTGDESKELTINIVAADDSYSPDAKKEPLTLPAEY